MSNLTFKSPARRAMRLAACAALVIPSMHAQELSAGDGLMIGDMVEDRLFMSCLMVFEMYWNDDPALFSACEDVCAFTAQQFGNTDETICDGGWCPETPGALPSLIWPGFRQAIVMPLPLCPVNSMPWPPPALAQETH